MELTEVQERKVSKIWASIVNLEVAKYHVDTTEPSYHILSFGGGRQTVALLLLMKDILKNNEKAYVIFADTGGEHQETYDYINDYIIPYCRINNIKFVRVYNKYGKTLYDYCWDKRIVPSIKFRDCTSKFKIAPIRKFIREELGVTRKNPCYVHIGISYDEATRMNPSNVLYAKSVYPFVDGYRDIEGRKTVEDCAKIVAEEGWPVVPKSGCWFCPFAQTADLLDPRYNNKTRALEENGSRYPEIKLRGMGKNVKAIKDLTPKDSGKDGCKSGYCMV
jgi:hypothetical protein